MDRRKKGEYVGALGALLVHVAVIALLILVSFTVPQPDEDAGGIPVMMGNVDAARGFDDPSLVDVDVLDEEAPAPAQTQPELPSEQDLLTQTEEETVTLKPKTEEPKKETVNPKEVVKQYTEAYIREYRRDLEPMYLEDEKDKEDESSIGAWYSYYKGIESHVQLYEKNLLVYRIDYNEYTGGAHGIYMTTFLNMDLGLMRPLRLDDVFVGEYQEALTDLIWNQLMADNEAKTRAELEDMGYGSTGEIAPTENFYLDKDGVTFYYNVYDITPYAMGPVTVSIPFQMLEHMLGSNPVVGELKN